MFAICLVKIRQNLAKLTCDLITKSEGKEGREGRGREGKGRKGKGRKGRKGREGREEQSFPRQCDTAMKTAESCYLLSLT